MCEYKRQCNSPISFVKQIQENVAEFNDYVVFQQQKNLKMQKTIQHINNIIENDDISLDSLIELKLTMTLEEPLNIAEKIDDDQ